MKKTNASEHDHKVNIKICALNWVLDLVYDGLGNKPKHEMLLGFFSLINYCN